MKKLTEVVKLNTQYPSGHPDHEKEVARASKDIGIHPDAVKKLIHNFNSTKIKWDGDIKKEKEAAEAAQPKFNTIKHSKHKKLREFIDESMMDRVKRHEYNKGYEHGFAGNKAKQDDDAYVRGHKSGMLSRSMKPNKAK